MLDEKCVFEFIFLVVGALVNINVFVGAVGRSKVKLSSGNLEGVGSKVRIPTKIEEGSSEICVLLLVCVLEYL